MKKIVSFFMCFILFLGLVACEDKVQTFDDKKTYTIDDKIELEFKAMVIANEILPSNLSDEYYYWSHDDKDITIVDAQFYVKNVTDQKVDLNDYITASLMIDDEEIKYELCTEFNHFTEIDKIDELDGNAKSIVHLMFYLNKDELKAVTKKVSEEAIELSLNEEKYTLPIKEKQAKSQKLALNDKISTEQMDIKILSASTAMMIPALNANENSSYYLVEDESKEYAGMYVEITNKKEETINLLEEIYVTIDVEGEEIYAWNSMLNSNRDDFEDIEDILANEQRAVLYFGEVDASSEPVKYIMNITVEGRPYQLTYER